MQIYNGTFSDQSGSDELAPKLAPKEPSDPFQPTQRRCGAEYAPPDEKPAGFPALYGRYEFLRKIEEVAPEVLEGLVASVRPHYEPLRAELGEFDLLTLSSASILQRIATGQNNLAPLNSALISWSRRFHLDADWVRDFALNTLLHWTGQRIVIGISPGWAFWRWADREPSHECGKRDFNAPSPGWEMTYATKADL